MGMVFLAVAAVIVITDMLFGLGRGLARSVFRLITQVFSAVAAFIGTKVLIAQYGATLTAMLKEQYLNDPNLLAYFENNPGTEDMIVNFGGMLLAPIMFLVAYLVLKLLTYVIYAIISAIFKLKKRPANTAARLFGGMLVGVVSGVVGFTVLLIPMMGYISVAGDTVALLAPPEEEAAEIETVPEGEEPEDVQEESISLAEYNEMYIVPLRETPGVSQLYNVVGKPLFDRLTTAKFGEKETNLSTECGAIAGTFYQALALTRTEISNYGEAEKTALNNVATGVGDSVLLSTVSSGALNGMSNAWLKNETFFGLAKPQIDNQDFAPLLDSVLLVFSTSSPDNIASDLLSFSQLFGLMVDSGVFATMGEDATEDAAVAAFANASLLSGISDIFKTNPRLEPIGVAVADVGMRMLVRELGMPENYMETCKDLVDDLGGALKECSNDDGTIDTEVLADKVTETLNKFDVNVPEGSADLIAVGIAETFEPGELETLELTEITERLIERFGSTEGISAFFGSETPSEGGGD